MNRRSILKSIGFTGLMAGLSINGLYSSTPLKKRALTIAHITDVHAQPGAGAPKGFGRCLQHIQSQLNSVDVILNGGDAIMDALHHDKSNVSRQWGVWENVIKNECSLPIYHCLGNHDVWAKTNKDDLSYGKSWWKDLMKVTSSYRSFDLSGWHFIILDSIQSRKDESWYTARLDEDQFDWLKEDLEKVGESTPILILSHIPILAACILVESNNMYSNNKVIPDSAVHMDGRRLVELFYKYKNVKLCLSGHTHLLDKVVYNGVTYLCNGAVSGAWWSGRNHQTYPGYALINLYDDGSFDYDYLTYRNGKE